MKFILVSMFGTSTSISLTSLIKGGKTSNTQAKNIKIKKTNTIKSDIDLGSFIIFFNLLVKLQIMLDITREQIIRRRKSLRLQKIRKQILKANILKKKVLFKFYKRLFLFRIS